MSEFERTYEIERHKTIERPLSELRDMPMPDYIPEYRQRQLKEAEKLIKKCSGVNEALLGPITKLGDLPKPGYVIIDVPHKVPGIPMKIEAPLLEKSIRDNEKPKRKYTKKAKK